MILHLQEENLKQNTEQTFICVTGYVLCIYVCVCVSMCVHNPLFLNKTIE